MKTLPTNITSNYLLVGSSPRFFVYVANAGKKWGTVAADSYTNRLHRLQEITESIDPFGGMGSVSGVNVEVLKAGEEIKFYSSASVFPRYEGSNVGAGRIMKSGAVYATARGSEDGDSVSYATLMVGQYNDLDTMDYAIIRGIVQFDIPAGITSCEDAYLNLVCVNDASLNDFSLYVLEGSAEWATGHIGVSTFSHFDGWVAGGTADYGGVILNEAFSTGTHLSETGANRIRFNRAGRAAVVSNTGSVLKLVMVSSRDKDYDTTHIPAWGENEFVRFKVSVADTTPTLELIYNMAKPDNERTRVYLMYDDATSGLPTSVSTYGLNVWSGVVDAWAMDPAVLKLNLRHDDFKRNVKLTAEPMDTTEFPYCPNENIGKSKPLVVGDFTAVAHVKGCAAIIDGTTAANQWGGGDFFKGYVYDDYYPDSRKILFAGHELKEYGSFVTIYNSGMGAFVPISGAVATTSAGKVVLSEASGTAFPYMLTENTTNATSLNPITCHIPTKLIGGGGSSNPSYAVDSVATNWSAIVGGAIARFEDYGSYEAWGGANVFNTIAVYHESSQAGGYTSTGVKMVINYCDEDGTSRQAIVATTSDGPHVTYLSRIVSGESTLRKTNTDITVEVYKHASSTRSFRYRNMALLRGYAEQLPTEIFMKGKGIADDGSGTYTGTADALVENPSDVVRWLAMAKGGYSASEIDATFTAARTSLSGWKFAFQWSDELGVENLFNYGGQGGLVSELAAQCASLVFENHTGKLVMRYFDPSGGFPTSGTDVPAALDIFEYSGSPSSGSLTRNPLYSFNMDQWTLDETYNDFILRYKKNYGSGDYDGVLYMGNGGGVQGSVTTNISSGYLATSTAFPTAASVLSELKYLTSGCYSDINTTNTLVFEAWAIRDEATATKLLQKLIEWHSRRRFYVEIETGLNAVGFELGDFINVRCDDIEDQFGTAFMEVKKWKIVEMATNLTSCRIRIKAIEAEIY